MVTTGKRRAYGQHFLKDPKVIQLIAATVADRIKEYKCKAILEIGPGEGAITGALIQAAAASGLVDQVILSEIDPYLAANWREQIKKYVASKAGKPVHPLIRLEEGDFLQLPEEKFLASTPLGIASNLPYSSGTAILNRLAKFPRKISFMVLMFQAEVAGRLRAVPNTNSWGSLSIWIQNLWDVRKLADVPPTAFNPAPEVESEVVLVTPWVRPRLPETIESPQNAQAWQDLLDACFMHRRKMLRSGLPEIGPYRYALELAGIDGTKRAEALSWDEWSRFFKAFLSAKAGAHP